MSKPRRDISGSELEALSTRLRAELETLGVETMPKVATRLIELAADENAQIRDYAEAIKNDWALTGRVIRLANSAFYSQRQPVTRIDRALVVLGIDRARSICMGFYLSRAASGSSSRQVARKVWGQSVYRANLAAALAQIHCPSLVPEAFIVGLMLDAGQPLMARMMGDTYASLHNDIASPAKLYATEFDQLEYTHVDVVSALAKRWRLPSLLSRPIAWHHTLPPVGKTNDPTVTLQRLGYYVGAIQLDDSSNQPAARAPLTSIADRLFELTSTDLERAVKRANADYVETSSVFADVGDTLGDIDSITDAVQTQLVEMMDEQMERTVKAEVRGGPERVIVAGTSVEVEPGRSGEIIAYISAESGERLLSCTVNPAKETAESIARMLGLEDASQHELVDLVRVMQNMAA